MKFPSAIGASILFALSGNSASADVGADFRQVPEAFKRSMDTRKFELMSQFNSVDIGRAYVTTLIAAQLQYSQSNLKNALRFLVKAQKVAVSGGAFAESDQITALARSISEGSIVLFEPENFLYEARGVRDGKLSVIGLEVNGRQLKWKISELKLLDVSKYLPIEQCFTNFKTSVLVDAEYLDVDFVGSNNSANGKQVLIVHQSSNDSIPSFGTRVARTNIVATDISLIEIVSEAGAKFRTAPTTESEPRGVAAKGQRYRTAGHVEDSVGQIWWSVTNPSGIIAGYVRGDLVEAVSMDTAGNQLGSKEESYFDSFVSSAQSALGFGSALSPEVRAISERSPCIGLHVGKLDRPAYVTTNDGKIIRGFSSFANAWNFSIFADQHLP